MSSRALRTAQLALMAVFCGLSHLLHPSRIRERVRRQRPGDELTHFDQLIRIKRESRQAATTAL